MTVSPPVLSILVCGGADSCTKNTNYAVRPWLGNGTVFTVVDTPGFGDTDQVNIVACSFVLVNSKEIWAQSYKTSWRLFRRLD